MKQVLSIGGTTATGKTDLAFLIAEQLIQNKISSSVDIVSADSRQVYEDLKVISGADIPNSFKKNKNNQLSLPFFSNQNNSIRLHGVCVIDSKQEWSVSHFQKLVGNVFRFSKTNDSLLIIVGGSGLYHQMAFEENSNTNVKPDRHIREKAKKLSLENLQKWLKKLAPQKLESMNNSDKNNPRRLIRLIEIASSQPQKTIRATKKVDQLFLYLTSSLSQIEKSINHRVGERFTNEVIPEVSRLLKSNLNPALPAFSSTGVKEIIQFIDEEINAEECLRLWTLREFQYAKRQITWWKNKKNWKKIEVLKKDWQVLTNQLVSNWLQASKTSA